MSEVEWEPVLVKVSAVTLAAELDPGSAKEWAATSVKDSGLALEQEWAARLATE
jgi:hypothetical protein